MKTLPAVLCFHADVMYIFEAVVPLVATIVDLMHEHGTALVAHGRNCSAEPQFTLAATQAGLQVEKLPWSEMHGQYRAPDVTALRLRRENISCSL